jgi:phage terminase small subunit
MTTKKSKKIKTNAEKRLAKDKGLTIKQKLFCQEYIYDWNATRSYTVAYPNVKTTSTAGVLAHRMLKNDKVQHYLEEIQQDIEKLAGVSRMKIINEHMKLAFSSIAHLHNTWIERKQFEELTPDEKACISEISTQTRNVISDGQLTAVTVEFVKIKLYDKQKALDSISKMLGYDAPVKAEVTGKNGQPLVQSITIEVINKADQVKIEDEQDPGS